MTEDIVAQSRAPGCVCLLSLYFFILIYSYFFLYFFIFYFFSPFLSFFFFGSGGWLAGWLCHRRGTQGGTARGAKSGSRKPVEVIAGFGPANSMFIAPRPPHPPGNNTNNKKIIQ